MFFVSGRYKEQLKLLYKVHKVFCRKVFFWTQRHKVTEFFIGCGRYREQLKLLLQRTQSYLPQCKSPSGDLGGSSFFFLKKETQRHRDPEIFCGCGRYREQLKLLLIRTQSYLPQGFVATFKSLVIFVSRKKLCPFVSLCLILNT